MKSIEATRTRAPMGVWVIALAALSILVLLSFPWLASLSQTAQPGMALDPVFGIPTIPRLIYHASATRTLTAAMFVIAGITLLIALVDFRRRKDPIPFVLSASAVGLVFPEVFVEIMGACAYPTSPDNIAFTVLGRQMSWFIVAGWLGFGAPFLYQQYVMLRNGASKRALWTLYVFAMLASIPTEEVLLHFEVYYYYGNQPLVLFAKHPFWWAPCNAGGLFLAGALAYRFRTYLSGWRSLALFLLTPMAMAGMYAFIALPAWIVVNGNYSWLITQSGGLLTVALGLFSIALAIELVTGPSAETGVA